MGADEGGEHLLHGGLERVRAAQHQGASVGEVDAAARAVSGREPAAEVFAEDELGRVARRQVVAVDRDQRTLRSSRSIVDEAGDLGLAGAVFAGDEDRRH